MGAERCLNTGEVPAAVRRARLLPPPPPDRPVGVVRTAGRTVGVVARPYTSRVAAGERLGVLGGTFDPPHVGHLVAAVEVRWALGLDRVLLMVANDPWQKSGARPVTPAPDRLAMTRALAAGVDGVQVSDLEIRRGGPSYTIDTLTHLWSGDPRPEVFVVVGRDAAAGLPTWERAEELRSAVPFVVVGRAGEEHAELPAGWTFREVDIPRLDVSSSDLRARLAAGRPVDGLMPPAVVALIDERGLYRGRRP